MLSGIKSWLTRSHDSEGTSDGATHETAQPNSTTKPHVTPSHQPHEKSSMTAAVSPKRVPFGNSISRLFHETPDNPFEILSDEEADSQQDTNYLAESALYPEFRLGRKDRERSPSAPVRTRKLGGSIRRNKNDTIIPDPMVEEMERRNKPFVTGGLKAIDTLNGPTPPPSSRGRFTTETTSRSKYGATKHTSHPRAAVRENNHDIPVKKQRTGPSPKAGKQNDPIEVHDSQEVDDGPDFDGFPDDDWQVSQTSLHTHPERRKAQFRSVEIPPKAQQQGPQPTVLVKSTKQGSKQTGLQRDFSQLSSDDSLMIDQVKGQSDEDDGVGFIHEAARQRRAGQNSSPQSSPKRTATNTKRPVPDSTTNPQRSAVLSNGSGLNPESPDPIQQSESTQHSRKDRGQTPLTYKPDLRHLDELIADNSNSTKLSRKSIQAQSLAQRKRQSSSPKQAHMFMFPVHDIAGYHVPRRENFYVFYIDLDEGQFWFDDPNSKFESSSIDLGSITLPRAVGDINSIWHGSTRGKVLLKLSRSQTLSTDDFVIQLGSHKKVIDLTHLLQSIDEDVKVVNRDDDWLDKAFERKLQDMEEIVQLRERQHLGMRNNAYTKIQPQSHDGRRLRQKRQKLTDTLDAPADAAIKPTVIRPSDRQAARGEVSDELAMSSDIDETNARNGSATDPAATSHYFQDQSRRSKSLRSAKQLDRPKYRSPSPKRPVYSERIGLGPKWENDLVFPKTGKKRETVEFNDLYRLDEDEFLNDVLIGFFARYVQHQVEEMNPKLLQKMHFFNTYFFDTLTKSSKARKEVHHSAVARWTKAINIFSRDFVVVPVNDNLHWYLAIICNLSRFTEKKDQEQEESNDEVNEGDSSVQIFDDQGAPLEEVYAAETKEGQRTQQTQRSFQDMTLEEMDVEDPSSLTEAKQSSQTERGSPLVKSKPGRRKRAKRSLPKYDTEMPVIITLDSLAQPRSAAISALKDYVVLEAKARGRNNIQREDIKGMTAKGIPTQGNYSDCGLYMCMYLEQFMADPYGFIRKILQREEGELRWPKTIQGEKLRMQLRNLIIELHHRQEAGQPDKVIASLGKILVEMREMSPEVIPSTPPLRSRTNSSNLDGRPIQDIPQARTRLEQVNAEKQIQVQQLNSQGHLVTDEVVRPTSSSSKARNVDQILHQVDHDPPIQWNLHSPIVLDDSPQKKTTRSKRVPGMASTNLPFEQPSLAQQQQHAEELKAQSSPVKAMHHSGPQDLADQMRAARSSTAERQRAKTASPPKRDVRSNSVSTELLSGIDSYAAERHGIEKQGAQASAENESDSELDSAVPETQDLDIVELVARESQRLRAEGKKADSQEFEALV